MGQKDRCFDAPFLKRYAILQAEAQYNLGNMYGRGTGVPENNVMAYMWWNLAAAQGDEDAKKNKGIVQEKMTPADISKAQTLSRECLAKDYKDCR